jgi:hypothetical protein
MSPQSHQSSIQNADKLLAALRSIGAPRNVEEWFVPDTGDERDQHLVSQNNDYTQAVYDVLAALGVVSDDGEATSPMAYYFVQSLLGVVRDGALNDQAWRGPVTEVCAGAGARLVRHLEETRLACAEEPLPLRIVRASTAVIKARRGDEDVYLMQYDEKARQFQPIGGKEELTDGSPEAAMTRELCEELALEGIEPGRDFSLTALAADVQTDEISASLHVITRYTHSFYHLTDVRFAVPLDEHTRWLTEYEMNTGFTLDGHVVSRLFEDYMPGMLPTLGYSLAGSVE